MNHLPPRLLLPGLLLALTALPVAAQQQDFSKIEISTTAVRDNIYMLQGSGGNIGVLTGPDGVVLIDDQYAPLSEKISAAVAKLSDQPVRVLLNTHWHGDHTGGNEDFAQAGAMIVAHDNVRLRMSSSFFSDFFQQQVPASPPAALPVVTFASEVTLHLNGQTIAVVHVPNAHTDGDAIIFFEQANVVHMGDTYFNGFYPYIDNNSKGSLPGMIAAINAALPAINDDTRIIPGHGPLADKAELLEFRDMLQTVAERIQSLLEQGKSPAEIVAAKPSAEFDARWGQGFIPPDRWIELVVTGMSD